MLPWISNDPIYQHAGYISGEAQRLREQLLKHRGNGRTTRVAWRTFHITKQLREALQHLADSANSELTTEQAVRLATVIALLDAAQNTLGAFAETEHERRLEQETAVDA